MKFAVVVFPGSNSDGALPPPRGGRGCRAVWHKDTDLGGADAVILPGGFAHGDYLRTGAIARFSPIMGPVKAFADRGGPVIGICNGFQVLLEAGMLPGAMVRNRGVKFISSHVRVRVEQIDTPFSAACSKGQVLRLPIAHGEGNYFAEPDVLADLEAHRQVVPLCRRQGASAAEQRTAR
jgi:phosphoribosylformylglycinamidine synthase